MSVPVKVINLHNRNSNVILDPRLNKVQMDFMSIYNISVMY